MNKSGSSEKQNILLLLLLLILLAAVLLSLGIRLFHATSLGSRLLELSGLKKGGGADSLYYSMAGETFALSGDALAIASTSDFQLIARDGTTLLAAPADLKRPAIAASDTLCVFYDVGGTAMYAATPDGAYTDLTQVFNILSADVSEGGYLTVVTDSPGYNGRVTVYNSHLTALFRFESGESGYPLCARISPDKRLVVSCVSAAGSVLRFFALDSETELTSYTAEDTLILDFGFLNDGTIVAITDKGLLLLSSSLELTARMNFGSALLADYNLSGPYVTVLLHQSYSGNRGELLNVSSTGEILGTLPVDREVAGLSGRDGKLLVQYSDELTLYDAALTDDVSYQHVENVKRALLCADGSAMLLSTYSADIVQFG